MTPAYRKIIEQIQETRAHFERSYETVPATIQLGSHAARQLAYAIFPKADRTGPLNSPYECHLASNEAANFFGWPTDSPTIVIYNDTLAPDAIRATGHPSDARQRWLEQRLSL